MISYAILYPGGNLTAIVTEKQPKKKRPELAKKIMDHNPEIEQVGFMSAAAGSKYAFKLDMMGGEFCINAARCAALLWNRQHPKEKEIVLQVSGCAWPIKARVSSSTVTLLLPEALIVNSQAADEGKLIDLRGIRFLVSEGALDAGKLLEAARQDSNDYPALGLVEIIKNENNELTITALVWVRETNTLIQETACGSGSIAACVYCLEKSPRAVDFSVRQPSGHSYEVSFRGLKKNKTFSLSGDVAFIGDEFRIE